MCEDDDDCPAEKQCVKHRCVDDENDAQYNKRNINNKDPSVNLLFAGSIFLSNTSYDSGVYPDGSFNYDHLFKYIKNDIRKADLAIVDQETMFETDKMNFIKKLTNTPSELGDAIYRAGFKVVLHATLYSYSKEERGIKNTLNFWKQKYPDVKVLGINEKEGDNENDYFIFQKNSMKIGLINFYGHDEEMIPEDKHYYINILKEEKLKDLVEKLANETDFLIVTINWGDKNSNKPNKKMISCATELAYFGVNLIIGYHPSITLPTSYIKASNGKIALVFWSLGHLVIDFKKEFSNLGAMANITISKSRNGAYISAYNLIPTINHKVRGNQYSVYKLSQYSDSLFKQSFSYYNFTREEVVERCEEMMGGLADCY
jgi:poly-gamma-glutamate synthesis protein (capsule biosynthesis protein)